VAYETGTIIGNEPLPDGRARLTVNFTGPSGEPPVPREVYIDGGTTPLSLKQWAVGVMNGLNSARTLMLLPALQVSESMDLSAIVIPPSTAGFYIAAALAMAKGASKNYLTLFNADADLVVQVSAVKLVQELTAAVTGLARGYRLFPINSHSGGTLVTPQKTDTLWPNLNANITARSNGVTANIVGGAVAAESLNEEETGAAGNSVWIYRERDATEPLILRQNEGVVVQQDAVAGVGLLSALIYFRVD